MYGYWPAALNTEIGSRHGDTEVALEVCSRTTLHQTPCLRDPSVFSVLPSAALAENRKRVKVAHISREFGYTIAMFRKRNLFLLVAISVALTAVAAPAPGSNAERVLARLQEVADSPNYYWAWTHPWMNAWERKGDARFAVTLAVCTPPAPEPSAKRPGS